MRGFASGIRMGTRVAMGETIGYVGMTGLTTGPHLHFEVLVNGVQRDPLTALKSGAGPPLASAALAAFNQIRHQALAQLDQPAGALRAAAPGH